MSSTNHRDNIAKTLVDFFGSPLDSPNSDSYAFNAADAILAAINADSHQAPTEPQMRVADERPTYDDDGLISPMDSLWNEPSSNDEEPTPSERDRIATEHGWSSWNDVIDCSKQRVATENSSQKKAKDLIELVRQGDVWDNKNIDAALNYSCPYKDCPHKVAEIDQACTQHQPLEKMYQEGYEDACRDCNIRMAVVEHTLEKMISEYGSTRPILKLDLTDLLAKIKAHK